MDTLTFASNVIGHLAWPLTVIITLAILLQNGKKISQFLKSIKYKDFELMLRDDFEKAKEIADNIQPSGISQQLPEVESEIQKIASIDPSLAIIKSWRKLESEMSKLEHKYGSGTTIIRGNWLKGEERELYSRLRKIRNEAVHVVRPLTVAEVIEYDQLVNTFITRLNEIDDTSK